jgi:hypothetical protein
MSEPHQSPEGSGRPFGGKVIQFWSGAGVSARTALAVAAGAACLLFAIGSIKLGIPVLPGFDGRILSQPSPVVDLIAIAVMLAASALIGTIIAGAAYLEAGLFAAAFGLIVISLRCGTMQTVLFEANGAQTVYLRLLAELLIFAAMLGAIWWLLRKMSGVSASAESSVMNDLTATVAQAVTTGIVLLILCQTEAKNQCLASVGIASVIGSAVAFKYAPTRNSFWYWIGPILVGAVGYILAAAGQDTNLTIGMPLGTFAALARPLPIDYAGIGVAGAIVGFWMVQEAPSEDE